MEDLGRSLREARESKDITLKEASQVTKIGIRFLKALENNEYEIFPSHIYLRSFVKNYANFLGLDGDKLAREFKPSSAEVRSISPPRRRTGEFPRKMWVIVLTMLFIWILWVIYQTVVVKF